MAKESLHIPDILGGVTLEGGPKGLRAIRFGASATTGGDPGPLLRTAEQQLREYLARQREAFDIPLDLIGTPFQLQVWAALTQIPYGQTSSYRDIATKVDRPRGSQAIGQANTRNPIPIIVPCHRVINADGSLGGYGGGVERKRQLLDLEQRDGLLFRFAS